MKMNQRLYVLVLNLVVHSIGSLTLSPNRSPLWCMSYKCDWLVKQELLLEANLGGLRGLAQKPGAHLQVADLTGWHVASVPPLLRLFIKN